MEISTKVAFMFPGQGCQEIGMGRDLFYKDSFTDTLIELASDLVHEDLKSICLNGPENILLNARFLQPSIVAICLGYWNRIIQSGLKADIVLGHSLGEITSLAAAGVVSPEEAITIATKRGELMDKVASRRSGGMLAVMFISKEVLENLLDEIGMPDRLVLANDNALDQFVLSGDTELLQKIADMIHERNLGKSKRVAVIGPWHSPFLIDVCYEYQKWVEKIKFKTPVIDLILNATAKPERHPSTIKHLSSWQLASPVFWRESMNTIKTCGVSKLIEIGPGKILKGLARVNGLSKETKVFSINNLNDISSILPVESTVSYI